jgi:hypothetical protein
MSIALTNRVLELERRIDSLVESQKESNESIRELIKMIERNEKKHQSKEDIQNADVRKNSKAI